MRVLVRPSASVGMKLADGKFEVMSVRHTVHVEPGSPALVVFQLLKLYFIPSVIPTLHTHTEGNMTMNRFQP